MAAKGNLKKKAKVSKKAKKGSDDIGDIARKLLENADKDAYYLRDKAIRNLGELKDNLHEFTEHEAQWVADWIEYLGDNKTAAKIRKIPSDFEKTIVDRYEELKKFVK
ncbi:hypothetical protein KKA03_01560 [archaeon]|nr:hypothetical protein [archaeon]